MVLFLWLASEPVAGRAKDIHEISYTLQALLLTTALSLTDVLVQQPGYSLPHTRIFQVNNPF